ncbi:M20/M25/M40 family metallo-hydrolase [Peribacillus simplex]|uniref:M20/M25/M40 family metallo-hydrolase n=1 Tax=Peribacillus simplex TaxID=1478 RepID=UPI00288C11EB|nr:M20/M25/M40 family metallo-hydrolase [Peribacillus simplex]
MSVFYHKERVYAASVDQEAAQFMEKAIENTLGANGLVGPIITPGGEDFHFYTKERHAIKATMLGGGCDLEPGLHHPNMVFNQEAIFTGIEILTRAESNNPSKTVFNLKIFRSVNPFCWEAFNHSDFINTSLKL